MDLIINNFKMLLGLDQDWKKQWDEETIDGEREINEDHNKRGTFHSGIRTRDIDRYKMRRLQQKEDETRKRLLEGLNLLPSWLALVFSILSLVVSVVALYKSPAPELPTGMITKP